jgi:hypothetical protein
VYYFVLSYSASKISSGSVLVEARVSLGSRCSVLQLSPRFDAPPRSFWVSHTHHLRSYFCVLSTLLNIINLRLEPFKEVMYLNRVICRRMSYRQITLVACTCSMNVMLLSRYCRKIQIDGSPVPRTWNLEDKRHI